MFAMGSPGVTRGQLGSGRGQPRVRKWSARGSARSRIHQRVSQGSPVVSQGSGRGQPGVNGIFSYDPKYKQKMPALKTQMRRFNTKRYAALQR